jgi:hypothetical protein
MNQIDTINETTIVERIEADGQLVLDGMPEPIEETEATLTIDEIVEQIVAALGLTEQQIVTLYKVSKVLNGVLDVIDAQKDGKDYRVTSQMVYQYGRNKMVIKGRQLTGADEIRLAETLPFIKRFSAKFVR